MARVSLQACPGASQRMSTVGVSARVTFASTHWPTLDSRKPVRQLLGAFITKSVGAGGPICGTLTVQLKSHKAGRAAPHPRDHLHHKKTRRRLAGSQGCVWWWGPGCSHRPQPRGPVQSQGRIMLVQLLSPARREPYAWLGRGAL